MEILKFVCGGEFGDVHAIWQDTIWWAFEEMLTLVSCDMGDCSEDVGRMSGSAFYAVPVINPTFPGLLVDIEVG